MKNTKRIMSIILSLVMLSSLSVFAAEFPDVASTSTEYEAINILSDFGIVKGYEDGNYKPDKEVTRAEITSLLMRMLNLSITGVTVTDSGYTDVAESHWAVYDIKTASSRGIIKGFGDGKFGPEQSVTYEQAVKMIVCLLGYENRAIELGGWPDGYMTQARNLSLLKKTEMAQTSPAPRKVIAQLLFNALEVKMMEKSATEEKYYISDDTLLGTYLKIEKITGKVISNSNTRLDNQESVVLDDEVQISVNGTNKRYKVGKRTDAIDLLGLDVVAYTKLDDNQVDETILNIRTRSAVDELTIDADEIISFTSSTISYEKNKNGKTLSASIASDAKYIYNDKYIDSSVLFANNLQTPETGTVTLVNSGSGYNLVKISSYKNYIVKTVDTTNSRIYVNTDLTPVPNGDAYISAEVNNKLEWDVKIKKEKSEIGLSSIKKDNIISVRVSDDSQSAGVRVMEILVSDKKATGKISAANTDDGTVTIGTTDYELARSITANTSIPAVNEMASKIKYGASGTYYLDAFGKIAYAEFGTTTSSYSNAYLIKAASNSTGGDTAITVKIYDASKKATSNLKLANKVIIDGVTLSNTEAILDALKQSALLTNKDVNITGREVLDYAYSQPIKYLKNSSGLINEINTIATNSSEGADTFKLIDGFDESGFKSGFKYNSNRYFTMSDGKTIKIDTKTLIYLVPADRSVNNDYSIKTSSYFVNNTNYSVEAFDVNSSGIATVLVLYDIDANSYININSPIIVVEEIKTVNADGETKTRVKGYNFTSGASAEYYVEDASYVADIEKGDVIRFGRNSEGEINENVFKYLDVGDVSSRTYFGNDLIASNNNAAFTEAANYPFRRIFTNLQMYRQDEIKKMYLANNNINARTDRQTYILGTPLSVSGDSQLSLTFTDKVPTDSDFDETTNTEATWTIGNSVVMFVYDPSESENNRLTIIKSSETDVKESQLLNIKTYNDVKSEECDYIFTNGSSETLKVLYIIK